MNKTLLAVVIVVIIAAAAFATYRSSQNSATNTSATASSSPTASPTETATAGTSASPTASPTATNTNSDQTAAAVITNYAFSPATLTVKQGTKVTWTNKDSVNHTVTSDAGPDSFDSGFLSQDQSFSFTFTKAGTYTYFCSAHPYMRGTVVVTE